MLESFFANVFSREKALEIAEFIPTYFYYKKEDFLLELKNDQTNFVLTNYSSPKNYILYLARNNQLDKFLIFFDKVSKDVYQEIEKANSFVLLRLVIKLANDHKEKAKELAEMLPKATREPLIKKYSL